MGLRNLLYRAASLLGDLNAVKQNKVPERSVRKAVHRATGKAVNKLFKNLFK